MGQFDQTGRPLAKMDEASFFGWALSCCEPVPRLAFVSSGDTRRLVVPGEPERTNDLVARFRDEGNGGRETWLVAEIEDEAEGGILYRMAQYEVLLGKEKNPACDPDGPAIGSLLINLSGTQKVRELVWSWGGYGSRLAPFIVDVAGLDVEEHLGKIARGELGLPVAPFLALMKGGGSPEFIGRWKAAVLARTQDRLVLAQLREAAVVFAEKTPYQVNWNQATRDWMARESEYIKSWMKEGGDVTRIETKRIDLLKVIGRVADPVPESIRLAVEGTTDLDKLDAWHDAALDAFGQHQTIHELIRAMKLEP